MPVKFPLAQLVAEEVAMRMGWAGASGELKRGGWVAIGGLIDKTLQSLAP